MAEEKRGHLDKEAVLLLNRGRRGLRHLVFGRTAVIIALLAAQAGLLAAGFLRLGEYLVYGGSLLLSLVMALVVINRPGNPAKKITWIFLIMLVPVFAIPFYIYVDREIGHRLVRRRLEEIGQQTAGCIPPRPEAAARLRAHSPGAGRLAAYLERCSGLPVFENSQAAYLPSGEAAFEEMLAQLETARKFIFLEFFIVEEGYMWGRILSVLERKAREGVEVRVLYDGTCAIGKLPYRYPRQLEELGIRCRMYAPLRPLVSTHYNNRDHRKIMVIDGRAAFTGGVNLADEYINRVDLHGHWKDTAVRIEGEGVWGFATQFMQMWKMMGGTFHNEDDYYRPRHDVEKAQGWCQPFTDGPLNNPDNPIEEVYLQLIASAQKMLYLTTPYYAVEESMQKALCIAADGGVDVRLFIPGIPDHHKFTYMVAETYWGELLSHGVKIYKYTPGFLHAKSVMADREVALVGSTNMDYRTFQLHYECGVLFYHMPVVEELLEDMDDDDDDWQETAGGRIWHPQVLPVNLETMANGEIVWLGEYTLSDGDRIWYDVSAETGNGLQVGFVKPGDTHLNTIYYSVKNLRQEDETLECTASFTVKPPVKPGTYKLFLRATDGVLGNVTGSISIGFAAKAS